MISPELEANEGEEAIGYCYSKKRLVYSLKLTIKKKVLLWKKNSEKIKPISYNIYRRPRSQDMKLFAENGAIYISKSRTFLKYKNRLGGKIVGYEMDEKYSIDIDSLKDFKKTETILKANNKLI